jgi:predicted nucleic acid-binding protein
LGLDRLLTFLSRHNKIALDTSVFIYHLEANKRHLPFTQSIFDWLERSGHRAVTSTITMTEVLVHPYRQADVKRANELYGLLSRYPNLQWVAPDLETAELAARLRAQRRLKTADALQAATAVRAGASAFVTNDPDFSSIPSLEVLLLERLL